MDKEICFLNFFGRKWQKDRYKGERKKKKYVLFSITINDTIIDNVYNCYPGIPNYMCCKVTFTCSYNSPIPIMDQQKELHLNSYLLQSFYNSFCSWKLENDVNKQTF